MASGGPAGGLSARSGLVARQCGVKLVGVGSMGPHVAKAVGLRAEARGERERG